MLKAGAGGGVDNNRVQGNFRSDRTVLHLDFVEVMIMTMSQRFVKLRVIY